LPTITLLEKFSNEPTWPLSCWKTDSITCNTND
jgi:hypothetical protein